MAEMLAGDILLFDGSDVSDVAGMVTHVVDNGIEAVTGCRLSHSAMVYELPYLLIESTIQDGKSGPQLHDIAYRRATYPGRMWHLSLDPHFRAGLDFGAMWACAEAKIGRDTYAIGTLAKWLASHMPILQWVPWFREPIQGQEDCAELLVMLYQAGGGLPGVNAAETSPGDLAAMRIYSGVEQLCGAAMEIAKFNCV